MRLRLRFQQTTQAFVAALGDFFIRRKISMTIIAHGGDPDKALRQQCEFFELLGRAISQWALLEDNIYHTYRKVIDPNDWVAAAAAYHAVINMTSRLDMIEAAFSCSKRYGDRLTEWEKLHSKIRKQSARRAKLAHWTVVQDATVAGESGVTMYLQPPAYDFTTKRDENGRTERITTKQIVQWANGFALLSGRVEDFWRDLA